MFKILTLYIILSLTAVNSAKLYSQITVSSKIGLHTISLLQFNEDHLNSNTFNNFYPSFSLSIDKKLSKRISIGIEAGYIKGEIKAEEEWYIDDYNLAGIKFNFIELSPHIQYHFDNLFRIGAGLSQYLVNRYEVSEVFFWGPGVRSYDEEKTIKTGISFSINRIFKRILVGIQFDMPLEEFKYASSSYKFSFIGIDLGYVIF